MNYQSRCPNLCALFQEVGRPQQYAKGETIGLSESSHLIAYILDGYVKRYMIRNDGNIGTQIIYGPQDIFSLTRIYQLLLDQALYDGEEPFYYSAVDEVEVLWLSPDTLSDAVANNPLLYKDLFSEAGQHLYACVASLENMSLASTTRRVAHQLLFLAKKFGVTTAAGLVIQVPLRHQDLADLLGMTRETVTRAIVALRNQRLIGTHDHIVVLDPDRLSSVAYGEER